MTIVADDNQRALVVEQKLLEPVDAVDVEVVGRLVEQQALGLAKQRLRQQHTQLGTTRDGAHRPLVQVGGDAQTIEQFRGVGVGDVAVFFADDPLEIAEFHAHFFGEFFAVFSALEDRVFLFDGLPQALVAHHHDVEDTVVLVGVLVLAQDRRLLRPADRALHRVGVTGEELHERRLAGAVWSGEAKTPPGRKRHGDVFEKRAATIGLGNVVDGKHGSVPSRVVRNVIDGLA